MAGIADIGRGLQRYGLKVGQHPEFGAVGGHAKNSHHYYGEAIDVTDWRNGNTPMPEYEGGQSYDWVARTRRLKERAREIGGFNEVLGPGDKNHDEHLHLALQGKRSDWNEQMLEYLATGRYKGADGQYQTRWGGGGLQPAATSTADVAEVGRQEALAKVQQWQQSAADPQRVVSPGDAAYYQRSDIQQWAGANPSLATALMERHGIDPEQFKRDATAPRNALGEVTP